MLTIQCVELLQPKVERSPSIDGKTMTGSVLWIIVFCLSTKSIRNTKLMPAKYECIDIELNAATCHFPF